MERILEFLATKGIHQLLAVMAVDPDDIEEKVAKFYTKHGFRQVGLLKRVGFKFGKWIDSKASFSPGVLINLVDLKQAAFFQLQLSGDMAE
jgi:hypothetical protein